jgi:lipid-binding SYLF domain-containing protein
MHRNARPGRLNFDSWYNPYTTEEIMERRAFLLTAAAGAGGLLALGGCGAVSTASTTSGSGAAPRTAKIDAGADDTLSRLYSGTPGARELVGKSRAILVFPSVIAAGLGVGGQYGEGVLRSGRTIMGYYNLASVSVGLQIGAQSKAIIFVFLTQQSLDQFRNAKGWSVGADASVAVLRAGANGQIDVNAVTAPVAAFVMTNAGLMANLTLEGTKITRLEV